MPVTRERIRGIFPVNKIVMIAKNILQQSNWPTDIIGEVSVDTKKNVSNLPTYRVATYQRK